MGLTLSGLDIAVGLFVVHVKPSLQITGQQTPHGDLRQPLGEQDSEVALSTNQVRAAGERVTSLTATDGRTQRQQGIVTIRGGGGFTVDIKSGLVIERSVRYYAIEVPQSKPTT